MTYRHILMGRSMGIEPTRAGATIRCVNHFATTATMAGVIGFEPILTVLETGVLPLDDTPIILLEYYNKIKLKNQD